MHACQVRVAKTTRAIGNRSSSVASRRRVPNRVETPATWEIEDPHIQNCSCRVKHPISKLG